MLLLIYCRVAHKFSTYDSGDVNDGQCKATCDEGTKPSCQSDMCKDRFLSCIDGSWNCEVITKVSCSAGYYCKYLLRGCVITTLLF
jgi:hypothetical protein